MQTQQTTSYIRFDPSRRTLLNQKYTSENGQPTWVVQGGLSYYKGSRQDEYWVYIPNGYRVVGAMVPRWMQDWLRPCDTHGQAAIIHNYLCATSKVRVDGEKRFVSRNEANEIFLEAMKVIGVGFFKRWTMYLGAVSYRNRRIEKIIVPTGFDASI